MHDKNILANNQTKPLRLISLYILSSWNYNGLIKYFVSSLIFFCNFAAGYFSFPSFFIMIIQVFFLCISNWNLKKKNILRYSMLRYSMSNRPTKRPSIHWRPFWIDYDYSTFVYRCIEWYMEHYTYIYIYIILSCYN